jgi:hypothetical protein
MFMVLSLFQISLRIVSSSKKSLIEFSSEYNWSRYLPCPTGWRPGNVRSTGASPVVHLKSLRGDITKRKFYNVKDPDRLTVAYGITSAGSLFIELALALLNYELPAFGFLSNCRHHWGFGRSAVTFSFSPVRSRHSWVGEGFRS